MESGGSCEHDNDLLCIKVGQFLERVGDNRIIKKGSDVWSSCHVI